MTDPRDDQDDAARREEGRQYAVLDGQPVVVRPLTLTVTDEEAELLDRGEMPDTVVQRAVQQAIEDALIGEIEGGL